MKVKKSHQKRLVKINWVSKIFFLLIILLPFLNGYSFEYEAYEKKIKNHYHIRNVIDKMPRKDLEEDLREFIKNSRPSRFVGTPGHRSAQEYIEKQLVAMNSGNASFSKIEFQGFDIDKKSIAGVNFIWEKKGIINPEEVLILTANYDTILRDEKTKKIVSKGEMPGADNNASGVGILLSMMEILNRLDLPKTVRIVFLDAEELDSQGSKNYVSSPEFVAEKQSKKILGVINLTMLGHDTRARDKELKQNNMRLYTRLKSMTDYQLDEVFAKTVIANGKQNFDLVSFTMAETTNGMSAFDFPATTSAFWGAGLPAITLTQNRESDLNPRYMTSNDFIETLNINTYINVFRYVASTVLVWNYGVVK